MRMQGIIRLLCTHRTAHEFHPVRTEERRFRSSRAIRQEQGLRGRPTTLAQHAGQPFDGWRLIETGKRNMHAEDLPHLSTEAYCKERVSSQRKEIVLYPNGLQP